MAAALLDEICDDTDAPWRTRPPLPSDSDDRFARFDRCITAHAAYCNECKPDSPCIVATALTYCLKIGPSPADFSWHGTTPEKRPRTPPIPLTPEEVATLKRTHDRWHSEGVIQYAEASSNDAPAFVVYRSKIIPGQEQAALDWARQNPHEVVAACEYGNKWPESIYVAKPRGVYNLKLRNARMRKPPMAYPSLTDVVVRCPPNSVLLVMDFTEGYTSVRMHPSAAGLLRCAVPGAKHIEHRCLPFGWRGAPFVFCFLSAFVADCLKHHVLPIGCAVSVYIDDIAVAIPATALSDGPDLRARAVDFINSLGFKVNPAKTQGPAPSVEFLGWSLAVTPQGVSASLPSAKAYAYQIWAEATLSEGQLPFDAWRKLMGRLQHATHFVPGAKPRLADLYSARTHARKKGAHVVKLTQRARTALEWLSEALRQTFRLTPWATSHIEHEGLIATDASAEGGIGIVIATRSTGQHCLVASAMTIESFRAQGNRNSTLLEILAVEEGLRCWASRATALPSHKKRTLYLVTDSQAAKSLLKRGSSLKSEATNDALLRIFDIAQATSVMLVPHWVPREVNTMADALSHPFSEPAVERTTVSAFTSHLSPHMQT